MKNKEFTFTDQNKINWIILCDLDRISVDANCSQLDTRWMVWKWFLIKTTSNELFLTGEFELPENESPDLDNLIPHIFNEFTKTLLSVFTRQLKDR